MHTPEPARSASIINSRSINQFALEYGVIGFELAGALWLGNDDELGHSLWQSVDASAVSAVGATGLKLIFGDRISGSRDGGIRAFPAEKSPSRPASSPRSL